MLFSECLKVIKHPTELELQAVQALLCLSDWLPDFFDAGMAKLCENIVNLAVRLPEKSILRFSLMIHPFGEFHKNTHTLAYDQSSSTLSTFVDIGYPRGGFFWGTCNGSVCLTTTCKNYIVLWNPATKEFKELPVPIRSDNRFSYTKYGFGYDDKIDDFKVISFLGIQEKPHCEVRVYTLKSSSWRRLETIPYDLYYPG
ncbi:F-box protein CPR1-like [Papaver somniferum]|uniref:F-box protein CPR1-like n=1 Tax=Papaver somniferum TaxID=3469 RepID=UPI000E7009A1|nr:F-box protein CPR1-like [Papaver somniferum]